ncbi:hypothetical protein ACFC1I_10905 [Microbacterium sp. NPDC056044]|uniref:hypothetical protein n=1 Tax=Microbacterium sp. NPDC056044 TaxID=3345690 RepID=UPI0035E33C8E
MSIDQSRRTMDRYFALMGSGEDFAVCYRPDATWSVVDTGEVIAGAAAVGAYVVALHASSLITAPDHTAPRLATSSPLPAPRRRLAV